MFDQIAALSHDAGQMFQLAAKQLVEAGQFHQLFDLRLMQRRHELGVPLDRTATLDDLDQPLRQRLESAYLDACREVGQLLLEAGRAGDAWTYLQPACEKQLLQSWLAQVVPTEESADELIELALHQGVDPERGFAWLLAQRGTCNSITELESICGSLPMKDQIACTTVLVRHLHKELLDNVRGHLERLEQDVPESASLSELLAAHPDLMDEGAYHIDTSHLATTVRFARLLTEPALLRLSIELANYGSHLTKDLQYPDSIPFEDTYPTHLLLFRATLNQDVDQALEYFARRADEVEFDQHGTSAIETYLILLERVGRADVALNEYARLVPDNYALSPYAPTLAQLAKISSCWDRYLEICEQRADLVGFAAGQLSK
ncbi:MAG: hypothetical protein GXP26_06210 [Planctomycetes bacterium]|nr:hypothetical protein [Planctomycetota bacterium]